MGEDLWSAYGLTRFYYLSRYLDLVEGLSDEAVSRATAETARLLGRAREWARWLAGELEGHGVVVEEILLSGSVARGDFREDGDLDLVMVSEDWSGMSPRRGWACHTGHGINLWTRHSSPSPGGVGEACREERGPGGC